MNDFDRLLEIKLRHMLDPVVVAVPPMRGGKRKRADQRVLPTEPPLVELAAGAITVRLEPIAIPVPATHLLS
ncbi:MAG TPA: hypothetical protein VGE99_13200 [Candidatus Dormibacteraeota bacterium]